MNNETPKPHLVVLTGAGISRESGIPTFRDSDGLWCGYRVEDVATADALQYNTKNVLDFLNDRRRELANVQPNPGHFWLAKLEEHFRVSVLTQNIDDLHERAGSSHIIHLHGELKKATSMIDPDYIRDIGYAPIQIGDRCPHGGQLRPFVVLFGEPVPMMQDAACIAATADVFAVIGTSLVVYPAAGLVECAPPSCSIYVVDPKATELCKNRPRTIPIPQPAGTGVEMLYHMLVRSEA